MGSRPLPQLRVSDDAADDAAEWMAVRLRDAVASTGWASLAVSGGATAPVLFEALLRQEVPWDQLEVWQVDERIVPDGHPARNAAHLGRLPARLHPMPVTDDDLGAAAARYAAGLPAHFDIVHLGLGDDGHTASWPPDDGAVVASDRAVEVIGEFAGYRRMTVTPRVVNAARARCVYVTDDTKAAAMARWLDGDLTVPVSHVRPDDTVVFADRAAAARLPAG
jgi:6-phosphogluconolactonase/glucosamine-6-phosphate isomerase/deaminase